MTVSRFFGFAPERLNVATGQDGRGERMRVIARIVMLTHNLQTERKPAVEPAHSRDSGDANLAAVLEDAGVPVNEMEETLLNEPLVEKLTAKNAQLASETVKALPESPWYLAILTAAFVGTLSGLLFLVR
jgi:hypothetical protein